MKMRMHAFTSPDDNFIVASPTYKIMKQSSLPVFLKIMDGYGKFHKADAVFEMYGGGLCWFRTSTDPDSVVGITNVRHIWGDEAGLFPLYFWENLQARAAIKQCQIDLTTSPYTLNWVYKDLIRGAQKGIYSTEDLLYIKARSDENPYFPRAEYERRRASMDERRFRMMFGGEFERMEGLVYDIFCDRDNICDWPEGKTTERFFAGIDWGYTEPFAMTVVGANGPERRVYSEVKQARKTLTDILDICKQKKQMFGIEHFFCDPSRPDMIEELNRAGIPASPAVNDIKQGVAIVYEIMKSRQLKLIKDQTPHLIDEIETYHYPDPKDIKPDNDIKEENPVGQNDHVCLAGDTLVQTPGGRVKICDILPGDEVLTPIGFKKVLFAGKTGVKPTLRLYAVDGRSIEATADHPFYVPFRGFIPLDTLRYGDNIPTWEKTTISSFLMIKSIIGMADITALLVARLRATSGFTWQSGKVALVMCQRAFTFITKTTIPAIMPYLTLNSCRQKTTCPITQETNLRRSVEGEPSILTRFASLQRLGMLAQKVEIGIEKTVSKLGKTGSRFQKSVSTAQQSLKPRHITNDFARGLVRRLIDAKLARTMLKDNAWCAVRRLWQINTLNPNHALGNVLEFSSRDQSVYNLTVEDIGCFYANGFLVSNCDALRYCLVSIRDLHNTKAPFVPGQKPVENNVERIQRLLRNRA